MRKLRRPRGENYKNKIKYITQNPYIKEVSSMLGTMGGHLCCYGYLTSFQWFTVQAMGMPIVTIVIQERGCQINLSNFLDRVNEAILDAPLVLEHILHPNLK